MKEDFKTLFNNLCNRPYEAHWFTRVSVEKVLQGVPSDCSDRAYVLADYCEKNNIPYSFILTLFTKPELSLHIAIVIDNYVYDPIWKLYECNISEYKKVLNGFISFKVGKWIMKVIP